MHRQQLSAPTPRNHAPGAGIKSACRQHSSSGIRPGWVQIPGGYTVLFENTTLMGGHVFYIPGLDQPSWCKDAPAFRILVRSDWHLRMAAQGNPEQAFLAPPMQDPGFHDGPPNLGMGPMLSGEFGGFQGGPGHFQPDQLATIAPHGLHGPSESGFLRPEWTCIPVPSLRGLHTGTARRHS